MTIPKPALARRSLVHDLIRDWKFYAMFLPVAVYFLVFAYLPMTGLVVAFKEYNYRDGIYNSPWIGLENFRFFFQSGKALQVTLNTLLYNSLFLLLYTLVSLAAAVLIAEMRRPKAKKLMQTVLILPYFISWVTVSAFVYNIFNYEYGLFNGLLDSLGFDRLNIYQNADLWYVLLPIFYLWKWVGFGSVLYLAAIAGIDQECYEAATIDGASIFQRIRHITLPLLKPTIIMLLLLGLGRIMRGEFDMFYQLIGNNGNLMDKTDIIDTLVFRSLVGNQDFGMASAAGLYQSVLCFVIILAANALVRRLDRDQALF